jgi:antitoxin FitA
MSIMIQIRNVPDALHRRLKSRAALAGMSLSDYLLNEIREVAERPSLAESRARLERRAGIAPSVARSRRARQPMIVVDASAMLEVLLRTSAAEAVGGGCSSLDRQCTHSI